MKRYYLIPIFDENIYLNNKPLGSILQSIYPELIESKTEKNDVLYSYYPDYSMPEHLKMKYIKYLAEMQQLSDEIGIPYYLIAYGNDKKAKEIITRTKIKPRYPNGLSIRSTTIEIANKYYVNNEYEEKVLNLINDYKSKQKVYKKQ